MTETQKTHKIVYYWTRIPYIIEESMPKLTKFNLRMRQLTQNQTFKVLTETIHTAHGLKLDKQEKKSDEFEVFITGTQEQCLKHLQDISNLKRSDLKNVLTKVPPKFQKKVSGESTKFEALQEKLLHLNIILEVQMREL